jgi:hypothetical protein
MVALLVGLEAESSRGRRDKESGEVGFESRQHRNLLASVRRDVPSSKFTLQSSRRESSDSQGQVFHSQPTTWVTDEKVLGN